MQRPQETPHKPVTAPRKLDKASAHRQPRSPSQRPGEAKEPRPAAETIHRRHPAGGRQQKPRNASTPRREAGHHQQHHTPRKRCKLPVEQPTPRHIKKYYTHHRAAHRPNKTRHRATHAWKAWKATRTTPPATSRTIRNSYTLPSR